MKIALWVDMEGASAITDHRECWPAFEEYWESGRPKLMSDVVAAARGLLEGGIDDVVVVNAHGVGWPNLLADELPRGAQPADDRSWNEGIDAIFQVGFHARAGTPVGFVSHTMVPDLAIAVDGAPVTESHIWSWVAGVPLLGVVGDDALETQLDHSLEGTAFLAAKHSTGRTHTRPAHEDADEGAEAITSFARRCARDGTGPVATLPPRFTVSLSLPPEAADRVDGENGMRRADPSTLTLEAEDWVSDVQPAVETAMGAALGPFFEAQGDLDLSSRAALESQDPDALERLRGYFERWAG
ncbi:MAG: M55 family metallopeptidase [Actinomycetota bacterium]